MTLIRPVVAKNAFVAAFVKVMTIYCMYNLRLLKSVIVTHELTCYMELKYHVSVNISISRRISSRQSLVWITLFYSIIFILHYKFTLDSYTCAMLYYFGIYHIHTDVQTYTRPAPSCAAMSVVQMRWSGLNSLHMLTRLTHLRWAGSQCWRNWTARAPSIPCHKINTRGHLIESRLHLLIQTERDENTCRCSVRSKIQALLFLFNLSRSDPWWWGTF